MEPFLYFLRDVLSCSIPVHATDTHGCVFPRFLQRNNEVIISVNDPRITGRRLLWVQPRISSFRLAHGKSRSCQTFLNILFPCFVPPSLIFPVRLTVKLTSRLVLLDLGEKEGRDSPLHPVNRAAQGEARSRKLIGGRRLDK